MATAETTHKATETIHEATDLRTPIHEIQSQSMDGLINGLVGIQENFVLDKFKSLDWVAELECLSHHTSRKRPREQESMKPTPSKTIGREKLDGRNRSNVYVAVSYPWNVKLSEDSNDNADTGAWRIQDIHESASYKSSEVRDIVLDRATTYAISQNPPVSAIWIDMESIPQEDCSKKQTAMQSMDLVYKFSSHPVALIFTSINTRDEMNLLRDLLFEEIPNEPKKFSELLQLLGLIVSDPWWDRAWTFQEDYCTSSKMKLLIPHGPRLWKDIRLFGRTPRELEVSSAKFREEATIFCRWYRNSRKASEAEVTLCDKILQKAGKYTIVLDKSEGRQEYPKSMSVRIFQDIASKRATYPSDFLAIVANCCSYAARLDTKKIEDTECSLSLSTLALYFRNGEIFKNGPSSALVDTSRLTTLEYLDHISLDSFDCLPCKYRLSFLKRCRFISPSLTSTGVATNGVLWHLNYVIRTDSLDNPFQRTPDEGLLDQLVEELRNEGFEYLGFRLWSFLRDKRGLPSISYMDLMADSIGAAIREGKTLVLGRLPNRADESKEYSGIFVASDSNVRSYQLCDSYAFTAWKGVGSDTRAAVEETRLDKFVSLEVDLDEDASNGEDRPVLRTKRWMNGLCFFTKNDEKHVTFPWPRGLAD